MKNSGFDFERASAAVPERDWQRGVAALWEDLLVGVLGWREDAARARVQQEVTGEALDRGVTALEGQGWSFAHRVVLDVGCGTGLLVQLMRRRGARAIGVEPGMAFSRVAAQRVRQSTGAGTAAIVTGDGLALPIHGESVDVLFSLRVLEHVVDPGRMIDEIARVLKPGGTAFVTFENYLSFREPHYRVAWLPLLPKPIGALYLRLRGRDPRFLREHVFYTIGLRETLRFRRAGLVDVRHRRLAEKLLDPRPIGHPLLRLFARGIRLVCPRRALPMAAVFLAESRRLLSVNYTLELRKDTERPTGS